MDMVRLEIKIRNPSSVIPSSLKNQDTNLGVRTNVERLFAGTKNFNTWSNKFFAPPLFCRLVPTIRCLSKRLLTTNLGNIRQKKIMFLPPNRSNPTRSNGLPGRVVRLPHQLEDVADPASMPRPPDRYINHDDRSHRTYVHTICYRYATSQGNGD